MATRVRFKVIRGELVQLTPEELARELEAERRQRREVVSVDVSAALAVNAGRAPAEAHTGVYL